MTFTVMVRCPRTRMLGVAQSTSSLAVGNRCIIGRSRVGVVAFQATADPRLTKLALRLLDLGYHAPKVLTELETADPHTNVRQIGIIDDDGNTVAKTGSEAWDWKGQIVKPNMIVMGNYLTGARTIEAMMERLEQTTDEPLDERLIKALEAGREGGGDREGQISAAILVYDTDDFARVDLRVDVHDEAVGELRRVFNMYKDFIPYYNARNASPGLTSPMPAWREERKRSGIAKGLSSATAQAISR